MADDTHSDFDSEQFTGTGGTRTIYRKGSGPAVIVIAEMPGITPKVLNFARQVEELGCTVILPHLFGDPGRDPEAKGRPRGLGYMMSSMVPACINKEFTVLATGKTSPVVAWLRDLAKAEHERCGGPGVGAVGMCFTGGFALAMAVDDRMLAPVLSQPSMPIGLTKQQRRSIDISPEDLVKVQARCANDDLKVIGLRFKGDRLVPGARFEFLREKLSDAFVGVELDDSFANPEPAFPPHSVLTEHLIDEEGEPTRAALDQVLDLFRSKLLTPTTEG